MADVQLQNLPTQGTPADAHTVAGDDGTATSKFSLLSIKNYVAASLGLTGTPTAPTAAAGTNTTQVATTAHVFAERSNTATLTNKTLTAPTLGGIVTTDGAQVQTSAAMGALAVDVTKGINTKTIAADSTLTFSATPATDTWHSLLLTNSDTNPHTITIPSSYSLALQATITTFVIAASARVLLTWRRNATGYELFGDTNYLNNYAATANPAVTDDVTKGYGPGSLWLNATTNILYINETNATGAAVWNAVTSSGSLTDGDKGDITVSGSGTSWAIDPNVVTYAKMQDVSATARIIGRKTAAAGDPEECTLSEILDFIGSAAQGDILYRGASAWARLGAGTSGQFLQTLGAGANPQWATASGGGSSSVAQVRPINFAIVRSGTNVPQYSDGTPFSPAGTGGAGSDTLGGVIYQRNIPYAASSAAADQAYGIRGDSAGHINMPGSNARNAKRYFNGMFSPNSSGAVRIMVGLLAAGTTISGDPSAFLNCIFIGADAADTNLQLMVNDGSGTCTKTDLGANFPAKVADTHAYAVQIVINSPTSVDVRVAEMVNNPTPFTANVTTNLPAAGQSLCMHGCGNTGTGAISGGLKFAFVQCWEEYPSTVFA